MISYSSWLFAWYRFVFYQIYGWRFLC